MPRLACSGTAARLTTAVLLAIAALAAVAADPTDHKQYRDSKPEDCRECHRASGVMNWHQGPNFLREHRVIAERATNNCLDCHQVSYCLDCHNGGNVETDVRKSLSRRGESMPTTHAPDFISTHSIRSRDDPASCTRCHDPKFCSDCHARWSAKSGLPFGVKRHGPTFVSSGVPDPAWVSQHRLEAKRNLKSCEACHPSKADCSNFACHPGLGGR